MGSFRGTASGIAVFAATLLLFAPSQLRAQDVDADLPPAHLAIVDGTAMLARDSELDSATVGAPLIPGDRIQTTSGRVEIMFPDGSVLDVDEESSIELQTPTLIRMTEGRALLIVFGAGNRTRALTYQVDTPFASIETVDPGEYRISVIADSSDGETELAVRRGLARLTTERGAISVTAGQLSLARAYDMPTYPQYFNSAHLDAFDRWALDQRDDRTGRAASAQYLPSNLRMYGGAFDRYGSWEYEAQYGGYAWFPASAAGWQPYSNGYWSSVPVYGWTWIGLEPWAWPTHHYGRWGFARSRWFWIPEQRWSPAWVSWAAAPGYVSWCPLGFDNRPVFSLSVNAGNTWGGWVVLPRPSFNAHNTFVGRYAVDGRHLPRSTPFVVQSTAPLPIARAVPRSRVADIRPQTIQRNRAIPRASTAAAPGFGQSTPDVNRESRPLAVERNRAIPRGDNPATTGMAQRGQDPRARVFGRNPNAGPSIVTPGLTTPDILTTRPGAAPTIDQPRASRRWPGQPPQPVSPPPLAAPPPPAPASAPGAVPRWSAPSVGVPTWSAPSVSVPRARQPGIPAAPAPAVPPAAAPAAPAPRAERAVPRSWGVYGAAPTAPAPPPAAAPAAAPAQPAPAPSEGGRHDPASRHPR